MSTSTTEGTWPGELPAVQTRFVRPTARLEEVVAFYCDTLGLPLLHRSDDDGWTVVMVGLPGDRYHLEFVTHVDGIDGTAPTSENLQVFYLADHESQRRVAARLREHGVVEVGLDNPWWARHGALAFPDPDGWRVVLMPRAVPLIEPAPAS